MSQLSKIITQQGKRFRDRHGENVIFNAVPYRCVSMEVAGAKAGQTAVPIGTYGVFTASTSPRKFEFSPADFAPATSVAPPQEGDVIKRNGMNYIVTAVDYDNEDEETSAYYVYALRFIWQKTPAT